MREFSAGGPRSSMGKLRRVWREHLELESDDELEDLLLLIRLWHAAPTYKRLQDKLEIGLPAAGLRVITGDGAQSPYEQLIWRLNEEERYYFRPETLRDECDRAGLLAAQPLPQRPARETSAAHVGWGGPRRCAVRSFKRPGIDLTDTADDLLSLLEFFDGRYLHAGRSWTAVYEQLKAFFTPLLSRLDAVDLLLDTHASVAFAVGALLHEGLEGSPSLGVGAEPTDTERTAFGRRCFWGVARPSSFPW